MDKTSDLPDLLACCLWDLHAGCLDLSRRLIWIARQSRSADLHEALRTATVTAAARCDRLFVLGIPKDGPCNLWMAGILDDAERDARSIAQGPLLDVAIVGAVRKALACEVASIATAQGLARALSEELVIKTLDLHETEVRQASQLLLEIQNVIAECETASSA